MDSGFFVKIQKFIMISCQKKVLSLKYARMSCTVILTFFISSYEANKKFFFLKGRKFNFNVIKFTNWCSRLPFFFMYTRDVWNLWPPTMMTKRTKNLAAKNYVQNDYIKFSKLLHKVATSICGVWENIEVKNTSVCLHHSLFMNTNIHFF